MLQIGLPRRRSLLRRQPVTGLWLPPSPSHRTSPSLTPFARIHLPYGEITGREPAWEDVVDRFRRYRLSTILQWIGAVSSALLRVEESQFHARQGELCRLLLPNRSHDVLAGVERKFRELQREQPAPRTVALFHELQLLNAAKLALLQVSTDNPETAGSTDDLGEALLMVGDLTREGETLGGFGPDLNTPEGRRRVERFLMVNGMFHAIEEPFAIARNWDLYMEDRPHLRGTRSYVDLPATAERVIGLPLEQLRARLVALFSHWGKGVGPDRPLPSPLLETYFDGFDFAPEENDRFWPLVAGTPEELRRKFEERGCTRGNLRPWDVHPFEKRPLVLHDGQLFCPSVSLLQAKLGAGLHYLFLNSIPSERDRKRYLDYIGDVFEDYVESVFGSVFRGTGRFIGEEPLRARANGSPVCDGIVAYPDAILLVETKASRSTLGLRTEGDWEALLALVRKLMVRSARQLDATVHLIESGALRDLGVEPGRLRVHIPLAISLEHVPMNQLTYDRVSRELTREGLLSGPNIRPLQLLDVRDVEFIETAAAQSWSVAELLEERVARGWHRVASFIDYLHAVDHPAAKLQQARLTDRFTELVESAADYLRTRLSDAG